MSNNKQSSVDILFEELFNSFEKYNNGEFSFAEYMTHNLTLREQAKAMHKEEMVNSILDNRNITSQVTFKDAVQYYNEKFNNEQ